MKYKNIIFGGTFDHFHLGHRKLIDEAFKNGENIAIGITTEKLLKGKILPLVIESYQARKDAVVKYLTEKSYLKRSKIIPLNDIFGNSKTEKNIDAIVVTSQTKNNALKINQWRKENKFQPLQIIEVPLLRGDDGQIISSERIRLGEIDREGNPHLKLFEKTLLLPDSLKNELRKPIGKTFTSTETVVRYIDISDNIIIAVGDIINKELIDNGFEPDVKVVDFRTRREKIKNILFQKIFKASSSVFVNRAGTINAKAVEQLDKLIKEAGPSTPTLIAQDDKKPWFLVNGEEDLLALPAILLAPLNSIVMYGQYGVGVVVIEVTEEIKKKIEKIIKQFQIG